MAKKALKKVEDQLNCSVCLDIYTCPKLLQCFHVYCLDCIRRLVDRDKEGKLVVPCPTCRYDTPVPDGGVAGLQSAFHINRLLEIMDEHKRTKELGGVLEEEDGDHASPKDSCVGVTVNLCPVHSEEELKLFCETCEELVCLKCVVKGKHHDHEYEILQEAFERYQMEITLYLEPMGEQLTRIAASLLQLETRSEEIVVQHSVTETGISTTIKRLQDSLDDRKDRLVSQLYHVTQRKLKELAAQKDEIEITQIMVKSSLNFMKASLETESAGEILTMKATIMKQAKDLRDSFHPDRFKPNAEADVQFSASEDAAINVCENYGQVRASNSPDPSKCHVTGNGIREGAVGEKSITILGAVNFKGKPCNVPVNLLKCELVSDITGAKVSGVIERKGLGGCEISYLPITKGRHELRVEIEGQHLGESPFTITVKSPVENLGVPILTNDNVKKPWGIAVNQNGEVIVTESGLHCVSVFSPKGEKIRSFGCYGSLEKQFKSPRGVAVDGDGNIIVADCYNHRIQKFTLEGQFLVAVGTEGLRSPLQFHCPHGIAYSHHNKKVYIVDCNNHVQVLNSDLTFYSSFGRDGSGKGQFNYPYSIACDSAGKVYVTDKHNYRVQVFAAEGKFVRMFGRQGDGKGDLSLPVGIAIDMNDMIYVSENNNFRVSVFTAEGHFVMSFGTEGEVPGEFKVLTGVSVDSSGVVYVCDYDNHCYKVF